MIDRQPRRYYTFGPFRLEPARRALWRDEKAVALAPKALEMLLLLVENSGSLLEKRELMEQLWPGQMVEEANLSQTVYLLRRVLSEGADGQQYIETIPRRGYKFVAPVTESLEETAAPGVQEGAKNGEAGRGGAAGEREEERGPIEREERAAAASNRDWRRRAAIWGSVTVFVLAAAGLSWREWRRGVESAVSGPISSLAILPFRPLASSDGDNYLGLGMADALITRLGDLGEIVVRSTGAVRKYDRADLSPLDAGRELDVDAVLEGTLQRADERLRLTLRLHDVRNGRTLWSGRFEERFTGIFDVQDAISDQVAKALSLNLTRERRDHMLRRYTENFAAYELYLKGRYWWNKRTVGSLRKAISHFEEAIAVAPDYGLAYAGLADCYSQLSLYENIRPEEAFPKAREAAVKALEKDETLAEAHTSLGWIKWVYDWDWEGSEKSFKRALELSPSHAPAYDWYGVCLGQQGKFSEALAMLEQARHLDPLSPVIRIHIGWVHLYAGDYEKAAAQYREVIEMDPGYAWAYFNLSQACEQQQKYEDALAAMQRSIELSAATHRHLAGLAHIYAVSGRRDEALKVLTELLEQGKNDYVSPFSLALVYTGLGDKDEAFRWLREGLEQRVGRLVRLGVDPRFKSLRSDPRFTEVIPPLARSSN